MEKIYVIYESTNIEKINFDQVIESNQNTLRYSIDGNKVILKFEGETPEFLKGLKQYTQDEMINIINDPKNGWIYNIKE